MQRKIAKYSKKTDRLLVEYPLPCAIEEIRPLFEVGDDTDMIFCYEIETLEQIAFFKNLGIPITRRADWFVECYAD